MPKSSAAEQSGESSTQTLSLLDEIIATVSLSTAMPSSRTWVANSASMSRA